MNAQDAIREGVVKVIVECSRRRYGDTFHAQAIEDATRAANLLAEGGYLVTPSPSPSPSAAHAELLKEANVDDTMTAMALDMPRNEYAISLIRRLSAALRAASPAPPLSVGMDGVVGRAELVRALMEAHTYSGYKAGNVWGEMADWLLVHRPLALTVAASPSPGAVEDYERGVHDVLRIRCMAHRDVPQMNVDADGSECGACIAQRAQNSAESMFSDGFRRGVVTETISIAPPSPGAVEAAFKEACRDYEPPDFGEYGLDAASIARYQHDCEVAAEKAWQASAARRGAAGGTDHA